MSPSLIFIEFVGAFFGAVFSFVALVWWEKRREHHDDQRAISAAKNELQINLLHNDSNRNLLKDDLEAQTENKTVVQNLSLLRSEELRYALTRLHKRPSANSLSWKIRDVIQMTERVNQKIQYRETYQIHMESMGNYSTRMTILDNNVLDVINFLDEVVKKLIPKLEEESGERPAQTTTGIGT